MAIEYKYVLCHFILADTLATQTPPPPSSPIDGGACVCIRICEVPRILYRQRKVPNCTNVPPGGGGSQEQLGLGDVRGRTERKWGGAAVE